MFVFRTNNLVNVFLVSYSYFSYDVYGFEENYLP